MSKYYTEERCVFDDDIDADEIYESIISDIENNRDEKVNWRQGKSVIKYIKESIDEGINPDDIYETAMHQLDELEL
jgi:hypothetical protein